MLVYGSLLIAAIRLPATNPTNPAGAVFHLPGCDKDRSGRPVHVYVYYVFLAPQRDVQYLLVIWAIWRDTSDAIGGVGRILCVAVVVFIWFGDNCGGGHALRTADCGKMPDTIDGALGIGEAAGDL